MNLPTGWSWGDGSTPLEAGKTITANITYTAEDKDNYTNLTATVDVTRAACSHPDTEVRNAKAATCTAEGYTGDTYCKDCGEKISTGTIIE